MPIIKDAITLGTSTFLMRNFGMVGQLAAMKVQGISNRDILSTATIGLTYSVFSGGGRLGIIGDLLAASALRAFGQKDVTISDKKTQTTRLDSKDKDVFAAIKKSDKNTVDAVNQLRDSVNRTNRIFWKQLQAHTEGFEKVQQKFMIVEKEIVKTQRELQKLTSRFSNLAQVVPNAIKGNMARSLSVHEKVNPRLGGPEKRLQLPNYSNQYTDLNTNSQYNRMLERIKVGPIQMRGRAFGLKTTAGGTKERQLSGDPIASPMQKEAQQELIKSTLTKDLVGNILFGASATKVLSALANPTTLGILTMMGAVGGLAYLGYKMFGAKGNAEYEKQKTDADIKALAKKWGMSEEELRNAIGKMWGGNVDIGKGGVIKPLDTNVQKHDISIKSQGDINIKGANVTVEAKDIITLKAKEIHIFGELIEKSHPDLKGMRKLGMGGWFGGGPKGAGGIGSNIGQSMIGEPGTRGIRDWARDKIFGSPKGAPDTSIPGPKTPGAIPTPQGYLPSPRIGGSEYNLPGYTPQSNFPVGPMTPGRPLQKSDSPFSGIQTSTAPSIDYGQGSQVPGFIGRQPNALGTQGGVGAGDGNFLQQQRASRIGEINNNPELKRHVMKLMELENATPNGRVAVLEAMMNRSIMTGNTIREELNSGFYGPVKAGRHRGPLSEESARQSQAALDKVTGGSNLIRGRTDQGSGNDPNVRGPGRIDVPGTKGEVYNFWQGKRRGKDFSYADSERFASEQERQIAAFEAQKKEYDPKMSMPGTALDFGQSTPKTLLPEGVQPSQGPWQNFHGGPEQQPPSPFSLQRQYTQSETPKVDGDKFGSMSNQPRRYGRETIQYGHGFNWSTTREGQTEFGTPGNVPLTTLTTKGNKNYSVHRDRAPQINAFVDDLEKRGYKIHDIGGYANRNKAGGGGLSTHATGTTIDINANRNAMNSGKTDMPENVEKLGWLYRKSWGGRFGDAMHFEVMSKELHKKRLDQLVKEGFITKEIAEHSLKHGMPPPNYREMLGPNNKLDQEIKKPQISMEEMYENETGKKPHIIGITPGNMQESKEFQEWKKNKIENVPGIVTGTDKSYDKVPYANPFHPDFGKPESPNTPYISTGNADNRIYKDGTIRNRFIEDQRDILNRARGTSESPKPWEGGPVKGPEETKTPGRENTMKDANPLFSVEENLKYKQALEERLKNGQPIDDLVQERVRLRTEDFYKKEREKTSSESEGKTKADIVGSLSKGYFPGSRESRNIEFRPEPKESIQELQALWYKQESKLGKINDPEGEADIITKQLQSITKNSLRFFPTTHPSLVNDLIPPEALYREKRDNNNPDVADLSNITKGSSKERDNEIDSKIAMNDNASIKNPRHDPEEADKKQAEDSGYGGKNSKKDSINGE